MEATEITIRPFQPGDQAAFRSLNEAWIAGYFTLEQPDRLVLNEPGRYILQPGGQIYMAFAGDEPVGCCALIPLDEPGCFELAKMTVAEAFRGYGIGRRILAHTIAEARRLGARKLELGSNRKLANAIHLYESFGFVHVPPEKVSPYARADVHMELPLEKDEAGTDQNNRAAGADSGGGGRAVAGFAG